MGQKNKQLPPYCSRLKKRQFFGECGPWSWKKGHFGDWKRKISGCQAAMSASFPSKPSQANNGTGVPARSVSPSARSSSTSCCRWAFLPDPFLGRVFLVSLSTENLRKTWKIRGISEQLSTATQLINKQPQNSAASTMLTAAVSGTVWCARIEIRPQPRIRFPFGSRETLKVLLRFSSLFAGFFLAYSPLCALSENIFGKGF